MITIWEPYTTAVHTEVYHVVYGGQNMGVFKAFIRSVICYAASTIASPCGIVARGRAIERAPAREQKEYLRRVTGAYRYTSVPVLEFLTNCPPNQSFLAKQATLFGQQTIGT